MKNRRPQILAYYFPNWHVDPRNEKWHGTGWTEWNVTKCALPRFPGHKQPKKPLWGYEDEADPAVMERYIQTAVKHGVDGFMFDWYYYAEGGPYRTRCLEEGLMKAANADKIKFAVMWCNHDAIQAHPGCRAYPNPTLCSGKVDAETFRRGTQYCIEHYFSHPSYLRADGKVVFSIYQMKKMVNELGGESAARKVFDDFRERVQKAGLGELHLNGVYVGYEQNLFSTRKDPAETEKMNASLAALGLDSRSAHGWSWRQDGKSPCVDYATAAEMNIQSCRHYSEDFDLPFNPTVMAGWDPSPRTVQSDVFYDAQSHPSILVNSTPEQFEKALRKAKKFFDSDACTGDFLMIHSWNEWTEGAFLLPEEEHKFGHLEAIKKVFGPVKQDGGRRKSQVSSLKSQASSRKRGRRAKKHGRRFQPGPGSTDGYGVYGGKYPRHRPGTARNNNKRSDAGRGAFQEWNSRRYWTGARKYFLRKRREK